MWTTLWIIIIIIILVMPYTILVYFCMILIQDWMHNYNRCIIIFSICFFIQTSIRVHFRMFLASSFLSHSTTHCSARRILVGLDVLSRHQGKSRWLWIINTYCVLFAQEIRDTVVILCSLHVFEIYSYRTIKRRSCPGVVCCWRA